jgi:hypothetical protein
MRAKMEKSQCIHEVWPKVKASGFSKLPSRKMMECGSGGRRNLFFFPVSVILFPLLLTMGAVGRLNCIDRIRFPLSLQV